MRFAAGSIDVQMSTASGTSTSPRGAIDDQPAAAGAAFDLRHRADRRRRRRSPPRTRRDRAGRTSPPAAAPASRPAPATRVRPAPARRSCRRPLRSRSPDDPAGYRDVVTVERLDPAAAVRRTASAPAANRSSGKSVSALTMTWPRRPCGRAMRPTTAISSQVRSSVVTCHGRPSRISSVTVLPSFSPAADASVRSAAAVRPCLPMTRPSSPGAT